MNKHEAKQEARRRRLLDRADKAETQAKADDASVRAVAGVMNGTPVLIGHHSEKRHRRDLERMDNKMRRSVAKTREAQELRRRAAAVGSGGVSSDDSDAVTKLRIKLAKMEGDRDTYKKANRLVRKKGTTAASLAEGMGWKLSTAERCMEPDFAGRVGFPSYMTTNLSANIRRVKARIAELEQPKIENADREIGDWTISENADDNRILLTSPTKPPKTHRQILKQNGFKWSPTREAWVRMLNNGARHAAEYALNRIAEARVAP